MELYTALYDRHSIAKVRPDPVPRAVLEKLLEAAAQAPNHHQVYPWRFIVMQGAALQRFGAAKAEALRQKQPAATPEALEAERKKALRAPVVIAVGVDLPTHPKVEAQENLCAVAAAIQNLLLAAHAEGLGAIWRTGAYAKDPVIKAFLGFAPAQEIAGFIYLGYQPEKLPTFPPRPPVADHVQWWIE